MVKTTVEQKICTDTYKTRGSLLLNSPLFGPEIKDTKNNSGILPLNCATSAYNILQYFIIRDFPSVQQKVICKSCTFENNRSRYSIMVNMDQHIPINEILAHLVVKSAGTLTCPMCQQKDFHNEWGVHLWIETSTRGHQDYQVISTYCFIFPL